MDKNIFSTMTSTSPELNTGDPEIDEDVIRRIVLFSRLELLEQLREAEKET